ncbi:MAG: STAS domain-containing protein [Burkholderiaceae bacterium]|nr:STAS domain-containing protein [Burkholderiaceae bacterium]
MLVQRRLNIQGQWLDRIMSGASSHVARGLGDAELQMQTGRLLALLGEVFAAYPLQGRWELGAHHPLCVELRALSEQRAKLGSTPTETVDYVLSLKPVLARELEANEALTRADLAGSMRLLDEVLNRMALTTLDAYVETRERIIAQQSLSLIELATPVIRLWEHILLLPLVGVIDTARARQLTESLLESITRYEARVTLIDVTGVPLFDTAVARHLIKTIDAAHLLGTRVVMTGLSPEGALTLTKLGISLPQVVMRATLRAGVAEALMLVGRRIVATAAP